MESSPGSYLYVLEAMEERIPTYLNNTLQMRKQDRKYIEVTGFSLCSWYLSWGRWSFSNSKNENSN